MGILRDIGENLTDPVSDGRRPPTEELRKQAVASSEAHSIELGNMGAVDIAKYVTDGVSTNMLNRKKVAELKRYIKRHPRDLNFKENFKVAMSVLAESNEFDDYSNTHTNVIDGMAL